MTSKNSFNNIYKMKNILAILLIFFIPLVSLNQEKGWNDREIAIVQWEKTSFFDAIRDSILNGIDAKVDDYQIRGKLEKAYGILEEVSKKKYKLVIMIGAQIITPILQYLPETPVIILGSSIKLYEVHSKFPNITGVYSFVPLETQFSTINLIKKDVKKIGVIYNPLHSGAQIEMLESILTDSSINIIKNGISNPKEINTALHFIGDIDILWAPNDPIYRDKNAIKSIVEFSIEKKYPLFSSSSELVERGAFASHLPMGISIEILSIIASLEKNEDISNINPRFPRGKLIINKNTANLLDIETPTQIGPTEIELFE